MKHLKMLALIGFAMVATGASAQKRTEKAVIKTMLYCNHCKACETCGALFDKQILRISGVKMYELDEQAMTITVFYNPKRTNVDAIRRGIAHLGFDADELKADPDAYEKLDACCKKS